MKFRKRDKIYLIGFSILMVIVIGIATVQVLGTENDLGDSLNKDSQTVEEVKEVLIGNEWQVIYRTDTPFDLGQYYSLESDSNTYVPTTGSSIDTTTVGVYEVDLVSPMTSRVYKVVIQVIEDEEN